MSARAFPETIGYRKFRLTHRAVNAPVVPIKSVDAQAGKGRLLLRSLVTLPVTILLLASASNTGTAARVCIGEHFHYGGSGLHHDRVHAQASAVRAWRAIQAESRGARAAANMYRASNQIHCKRALGNDGWRCFVRGGPCHTTYKSYDFIRASRARPQHVALAIVLARSVYP